MNYYLNIPKWDSFRVEIPSNRVTNKSHIGQEIIKVSKESGNIVDGDDKPLVEMSLAENESGVKYKFAKVIAQTGITSEERFVIFVNAKMLGVDYFQGINESNIRRIYDYIISRNILDFSYDDFLDGYVYDADCCYDVEAGPDLWHALCSRVKNSVLHEKEKYINHFTNQQSNVGLAFNNRNASTPTTPFIKLYHKGLELDSSSYEFNNAYIKKHGLKIGRMEYNFKRRKHFEYFGLEVKTLRDLLSIGVGVLRETILKTISKFYLNKRIQVRNNTKLGPQEFYIKYLISFAVEKGMGVDFFMNCVNEYKTHTEDVEYSQVNRLKNYISKSLDEDVWKKQLEENSAVDRLFNDFI
jgi:hypothetical protein